LKIDKNRIHKILIIKPAAIGDVLLCTPVAENLRHNFPDAKIVFLTQKFCKEVLTGNIFIDRILTYDLKLDNGRCIIRNVRKQKYDLIIDLFGNPRTAIITFRSGAKYKVGYKFNWRSIAYNIKVTPRGGEVHNIEFNLDSLRALDLEIITAQPKFYLNSVHHEFAEKFFNENGLNEGSVIGINPSGTWPTKVWYSEKFIELIRKLNGKYKFLLFWGNEKEFKTVQKIKETAGGNTYLIPETDLKYMAALQMKCKAFLTNDTGPMHIAWVSGVKTASIFGPTNPELQGPLNKNSIVIRNESLLCLGCNLTQLQQCPNDHKCMRDLSIEYVIGKLEKLIGE